MTEERQAPGFIIAATGLRAEARIAARSAHVKAIAGGGDAARLEQLTRQAIAQGGGAIISFGICAGLAPGRLAGTTVIGRKVVHDGTSYPADDCWIARLKAAIDGAHLVTVAGVNRPLSNASEKRVLHAESGAVAADMESHIVARLAAEHRLPFAVLRVIADSAEREIPPAAFAGMTPEGRVDFRAVLAVLARAPGQLPVLLRLASDAKRALAALLRGQHLLGPRLGFPDID